MATAAGSVPRVPARARSLVASARRSVRAWFLRRCRDRALRKKGGARKKVLALLASLVLPTAAFAAALAYLRPPRTGEGPDPEAIPAPVRPEVAPFGGVVDARVSPVGAVGGAR
ncbi:MAG: hypothetical protein ABR613_02230 [Actinomycetota bacterium]